jgi:hypothetical protein
VGQASCLSCFGGPALVADGSGYDLAGVNTLVEGYGGKFGDIGGGIVLAPDLDWCSSGSNAAKPPMKIFGVNNGAGRACHFGHAGRGE